MDTPKCPECGSEMKIGSYNRQRYFECKRSHWLNKNPCYDRVEIDPKQVIPMTVIAKDMANRAFNASDTKRKEQAGLKRTITGIQACKTSNQDYLSEKEIKALDTAIKTLDKYREAVERAKTMLKKIEEEEEQKRIRQANQDDFEVGEKFLTGLDHDALLQRCEILNAFKEGNNQSADQTELMRRVKNYRSNPKSKTVYRQLMQKVGRIFKYEFVDENEARERFKKFEKDYLKGLEVHKRRDNIKIVK